MRCSWNEPSLDFCRQANVSVINSWLKHDWSRPWTWLSNDGKAKRCLDYVMTEAVLRQYITNRRVNCSADYKSDHRLLAVTARTPRSRVERYRKYRLKRSQYDVGALQNQKVHAQFRRAVDNRMASFTTSSDIDTVNKNLVE